MWQYISTGWMSHVTDTNLIVMLQLLLSKLNRLRNRFHFTECTMNSLKSDVFYIYLIAFTFRIQTVHYYESLLHKSMHQFLNLWLYLCQYKSVCSSSSTRNICQNLVYLYTTSCTQVLFKKRISGLFFSRSVLASFLPQQHDCLSKTIVLKYRLEFYPGYDKKMITRILQ